jgi:hypothetical protein
MMFRILLLMLSIVITTACTPTVYVSSETTVNYHPPRDRSIQAFVCPTVSEIYDYLDNGRRSTNCYTDQIERWSERSRYTFADLYGRTCVARIVEFHHSRSHGYTVVRRYGTVPDYCQYQHRSTRRW